MKINSRIGIAGNIGVGKTTLTDKLSKDLKIEPIYESVIDNPYLSDFYENMSRWSFNLQVYFLYTRFSSQIELLKNKKVLSRIEQFMKIKKYLLQIYINWDICLIGILRLIQNYSIQCYSL